MNRRHHLALGARLLAITTLSPWLLAGCARRDTAPDVAYTLLDGSSARLSALRGKVTLVNFWATSCTTCVKEMPEIVATYQQFKAQGFDTVAVAMAYDPAEYVRNFAESRALPFTVARDADGSMAKAFGEVRLTPTTFLLDKQGGIVKKYVGQPDFEALHQLIGELLKEA